MWVLRVAVPAAGLAALATLAGCESPSTQQHRPPPGATTTTVTPPSSPDPAGTVWLCAPDLKQDPCASSLATTVVPASGSRSIIDPHAVASSPFDCFYVYPTVSLEPANNSDLQVQAIEKMTATMQVAPFSQVCRVWAPMYRQRTMASLDKGLGKDLQADAIAYESLLSGWRDYLAHYNKGRPIILIGHSQGAAILIELIARQIDSDPAVRSRLVVAIIAGGNLTVPPGRDVGAAFHHVPLCTRAFESGCAIAYSSYPSEPPAGSIFGRPGQGVSIPLGQTAKTGVQVACVNPAAIGGGTAALHPEFPVWMSAPPRPAVKTPWVTYPDLYTAECRSAGGATWLQVSAKAAPGDRRPRVQEAPSPAWGYHLDDINLALGNLVSDVRAEEAAYESGHHVSR